jgi:hypothetical protein
MSMLLSKANVYNALFSLDPSQPSTAPPYTYPTENCTWDAMTSLEIRASCSDITSELKKTCFGTNPNCTVSLDSGVTLWYLPSGDNGQPLVMQSLLASSSKAHKSSPFPVIQYILARDSNSNPEGGALSIEIGNNTQFIATECAL